MGKKEWDSKKYKEYNDSKIKGRDKKGKKKTKKKKSIPFIILVFLFGMLGVGLGAAVAWAQLTNITPDDFEFASVASIFYDKDGNQMGSVAGSENRTVVAFSKIPQDLKDAIVSIEDERFYEHSGIDIKRTAGAVVSYVTTLGKGSYGGSTITQQLIKNITNDRDRSAIRKIREWWRALQAERIMSKDQILEKYLNTIYLGKNSYGVQTASVTYFGKDVWELNLAECALLAGITNRPAKYDPYNNMEASLERQRIILKKMKELGKITDEEYQKALDTEIVLKAGTLKSANKRSYFVDMVMNDVTEDLMAKKKISKDEAQKMILNDGLKIYTTMDSKVQAAMDDVYVTNEATNFAAYKDKEVQPQSAMAVVDYKKGHIVGVVGGRGAKEQDMILNRATQSPRQPGSSIKPIAVYGPALEAGVITPSTLIDDVQTTFAGNWTPKNWYKEGFYGRITIRYAVEKSSNIPAVKVLEMIGVDKSYDTLKKFGISTLTLADKNLSPLSLGGLTKGVTAKDMAAAYGAIANGGKYIDTISYTKVVDSKGKVILENKQSSEQVISPEAAYVMTDVLKGVVSRGTGTNARLSNMVAAGKTGTTDDDKDKWFIGYTPYYSAAVWMGYDIPQPVTIDTERPKHIFKKVMDQVHANLTYTDFVRPSGVVNANICSSSGLLATDACSATTKTEVFVDGTVPTKQCTVHQSGIIQDPFTGIITPTIPSAPVTPPEQNNPSYEDDINEWLFGN